MAVVPANAKELMLLHEQSKGVAGPHSTMDALEHKIDRMNADIAQMSRIAAKLDKLRDGGKKTAKTKRPTKPGKGKKPTAALKGAKGGRKGAGKKSTGKKGAKGRKPKKEETPAAAAAAPSPPVMPWYLY